MAYKIIFRTDIFFKISWKFCVMLASSKYDFDVLAFIKINHPELHINLLAEINYEVFEEQNMLINAFLYLVSLVFQKFLKYCLRPFGNQTSQFLLLNTSFMT